MGTLWYFFGRSPEKYKAECTLPRGRVAIVVDDDADLVQPPLACHALVDALGEELKRNGAIDDYVTMQELAQLRQSDPQYDGRSIRELGQRLEADILIWLQPDEFSIDEELEMAHTPARFAARLKVFNVHEENQSKIRIYPDTREGKMMAASIASHEVRACTSRAEVHNKLAAALADKVAKLFYTYAEER